MTNFNVYIPMKNTVNTNRKAKKNTHICREHKHKKAFLSVRPIYEKNQNP